MPTEAPASPTSYTHDDLPGSYWNGKNSGRSVHQNYLLCIACVPCLCTMISVGSQCSTEDVGVGVLVTAPAGVECIQLSPVTTSAATLQANEGHTEPYSSMRNGVLVLDASQEGQASSSEAIAALWKRISELEDRLESARRRLSLAQRGKNQVTQKYERLKKQVGHFLAPDQLDGMGKASMRGTKWTDGTIRKALKVRLACGSRGYSVVKEIVAPLPTERTLQRHLEQLRSSPGALQELLRTLSDEVNHVQDHEDHTAFMDEVQLPPAPRQAAALDLTTGSILGIPTLSLTDTPK
ncbi:uncharacterized protein LOC142563677 [Dermacentor variabilis]|uniref:uncharacterized protein LOC142563677 n=1 Tax=Dermacentor variabilis TaxID=34621 RepID=UPI003F5C43E2